MYVQRYSFIRYNKCCKFEIISLSIECQEITLKLSQTEDHSKTNVSISIYNDIIINTTSITKNEQNTKTINEEIECTDKVRYIVLRKIMGILYKYVRIILYLKKLI